MIITGKNIVIFLAAVFILLRIADAATTAFYFHMTGMSVEEGEANDTVVNLYNTGGLPLVAWTQVIFCSAILTMPGCYLYGCKVNTGKHPWQMYVLSAMTIAALLLVDVQNAHVVANNLINIAWSLGFDTSAVDWLLMPAETPHGFLWI